MTNNISQTETNQKLTETEQELYDALLDEYNDIFENILIINEKEMFDKILENVKAILGEKKNANIFENDHSEGSFIFKIIKLSSRYKFLKTYQRNNDIFWKKRS